MQAKTRVQVMELQHVKVRLGDSLVCSRTLLLHGVLLATVACFSSLKCMEGPAPCESKRGVHCRCLAEVQQQMHARQHLTRL